MSTSKIRSLAAVSTERRFTVIRKRFMTAIAMLALIIGAGVVSVNTAQPAEARAGRVFKLYVDPGSLGPMTVGRLDGRTLSVGPGAGLWAATPTAPDGSSIRSAQTGPNLCLRERGWHEINTDGGTIVVAYSKDHSFTTRNGRFVTLRGAEISSRNFDSINVTAVLRLVTGPCPGRG